MLLLPIAVNKDESTIVVVYYATRAAHRIQLYNNIKTINIKRLKN